MTGDLVLICMSLIGVVGIVAVVYITTRRD
jgi:hypothetical protein